MESNFFVFHIAIILVAGLLAGWICKKLKASALIGYLVVGTIIGPGGLDLTGTKALESALKSLQSSNANSRIVVVERADDADGGSAGAQNPQNAETSAPDSASEAPTASDENVAPDVDQIVESAALEAETEAVRDAIQQDHFAFETTTELGVLLLLFAIGIEFTFDKLASTARFMFLGGALQMGLTILFSLLLCATDGLTLTAGIVVGCVLSLSSTALVYRSIQDVGQADTKRAQATLGLLIFQDLALVPMLLLLPRLFGGSDDAGASWFGNPWIDMAAKSAIFCALVALVKTLNAKFLIARLAALRSNDMVILFAVVVLIGMCAAAMLLGLTPALGALAAGVALGENRLTRQIDALALPFRETFSAIFFISLGMLMDFSYVFDRPLVCFGSLIFVIGVKCVCAAIALRACGMDWRGSFAFGLSISQVGELAFMLMTLAYSEGAILETTYQTILFVSVASLVITPNMVKLALTKLFGMKPEQAALGKADDAILPDLRAAIESKNGHAIVVGAGHIGGRLADELTNFGKSVCVVDFNPVNLHPFAQRGIATVVGDGANDDVLRTAGIGRAELALVTIPNDELALDAIRAVRQLNPTTVILSRARYRLNIQPMRRAGAECVFCEENNICDALLKLLDDYYSESNGKRLPAANSTAPSV